MLEDLNDTQTVEFEQPEDLILNELPNQAGIDSSYQIRQLANNSSDSNSIR